MSDTTAVTSTPTNDAGNATTDSQSATTTPESTTAATEAVDAQTSQATETKDGDKTPEPQVPESYEFAMPEGVELDTQAADEFTAIAKELKLDQTTAQKVADVGAKMAQRWAEKQAETVKGWVEQVKADKEIGGDKLDENLAVARTAMDKFGTPELKDVLNATGLGNHPEVIKAFLKVGKAISEDGIVKGQPSTASTDPAKKMFPNMN